MVAQVEARLESVRHRGGIFARVLPSHAFRLPSLAVIVVSVLFEGPVSVAKICRTLDLDKAQQSPSPLGE